jgi:hypothetical protein
LQAVAFAQAVRHMEADGSAEHLDGGLQQHHGRGAVHVVVAVKKHRLAERDGALQAVDGRGHAQHELGVVEMREFGIQESEGLAGLGDAAGHEQFRKHMRQACGFGQ